MKKKSRRGFLAFGMGAAAGIGASVVASREQFKQFILDAIAKYPCGALMKEEELKLASADMRCGTLDSDINTLDKDLMNEIYAGKRPSKIIIAEWKQRHAR